MVYCIASLVLSHVSFIFFLLTYVFLLYTFWEGKLHNTVLLVFSRLVFKFYKYVLI